MAHQKGSTVDLQIGYETTFGTASAAGFNMSVNSFGLKATQAKNAPATLTGTRNPASPFDGNVAVAGPIVVPIDSGCHALLVCGYVRRPRHHRSRPLCA